MPGHVVTRSVLIPAGREDVWDALVDPSRLEDWLADEVDGGELVPDAEVVFRWDDGSQRLGVVEEADAPRRLAFRWAADGGEQTTVSFDLVEETAGTRVTVVETGLTPLAGPTGPTGLAGLTGRSTASRAVAGGSWASRLSALGLAARAVLA